MLPKNNRNICPDNNNAQQPTAGGNQQFRPFSYNSNLVVTQQHQPNRNNVAFHLSASNNNNVINQTDGSKRYVSVSSNHINRPVHISPSQGVPVAVDRPQIVRPPQSSQADSASMNNIYKALYLIQQNQLQTDKIKPVVSTVHGPTGCHAAISVNSSSQNRNPTVLTMSDSNLQLLEVLGRLVSQQTSNQNAALLQPDSITTQHLLNSLQKQTPRTSSGFMVIGQTPKSCQNKDSLSMSTHSNGPDLSNSLLLKMPLNSKTDIPWTKLLDNLSNNPENLADVNRSHKVRYLEENSRNVNTKAISQPMLSSENHTYHINESTHRNSDNHGFKPIPKASNMNDTHEILRDSKLSSHMIPISNNMSINNEDMVNLHFQQSLKAKLDANKPRNHDNSVSYKVYQPTNGNPDKLHLLKSASNTSNTSNTQKKSYFSFIDFERPDLANKTTTNGPVRVLTPNQTTSSNNNVTIKARTDKMVEELLLRSLESNVALSRHSANSPQIAQDTYTEHGTTKTQSSTHTNHVEIRPRQMLTNSTTTLLNSGNMTHIRSNPSKSDLPLKKRIMLAFNENGDENIIDKPQIVAKIECKTETMPLQKVFQVENQKKIRRKRIRTDSLNSDSRTGSPANDPNMPLTKKRRGRIPGTGKKQKMKEEEFVKISFVGTEETWQELSEAIIKPPDIEKISAKTLTKIDLSPLKLSREPFFQLGSCMEIAPRMVKCRSCRQNSTANNTNNEPLNTNMDDASSSKSGSKESSSSTSISSFCRFHGFRKLQFSVKGTLTQAGFCKSKEADDQDLSLWRMYHPLPSEISVTIATYMIESLGSIFCDIIDSENKFLQEANGCCDDLTNRNISTKKLSFNSYVLGHKQELNEFVWKRPVLGVREMCDVCDTSIFNTHWACRKCGYSICVDCFNERYDVPLHGPGRQPHVSQLELKDADSDVLENKGANAIKNSVHPNTRNATRNRYFSSDHPWAVCTVSRQQHQVDQMLKVELIPIKVVNELRNRMHTVARLLHLKLKCNCLSRSNTNQEMKMSKQISVESIPAIETDNLSSTGNYDLHMLADIALKEVVVAENKSDENESHCANPVRTVAPRPPPVLSPPHHPENIHYQELKHAQSNEPVYSWINVSSSFRMIHLRATQNPENLKLFQQEWSRANPVLVSGCHNIMDLSLWTPEKFLEEFESEPALLVDCETGFPVPKATMKSFWEGFSCVGKRISSSEGSSKPACLKLKDWPPSDDISDVLPQRCKDVLSNLPIKEYTGRQGGYNLASHLHDFFVCPDLGPKLYNAYGMPKESKLGTTNLHLDIADAVNVMLYVGVPHDQIEIETQNTIDSMREAMVDETVLKRAETELPGALWHIFFPKDVPKLREFLVDVLLERGESMDSDQDPIHDQQFYLNQTLLNRLKKEKNVEGCAVIQFRGDAVFVPAGSPHQVRNLHSCMKVANDFVSPENILNCLLVTKEFRKLSSTHANHEDKLQAKNMIFHAIKDAVSTLIVRNSFSMVNGKSRDCHTKRRTWNQTGDSKLQSASTTSVKKEQVEDTRDLQGGISANNI